jgi:hypothetical protein
MVGISKTEVGDSMDLLLGKLAALGFCQPDGTFFATLAELCERLGEMARSGEAVVVDGLATRVQRPSAWANQKVLYDAKRHTHTVRGLAVSTIHGDLLWCDGGWSGSCHEQDLIELSGLGDVLDADGVVTLLDPGGFGAWPSTASTGMRPSGTGEPGIGSPAGSGRSTAVRRGCVRWSSRRSATSPMPGRCAAGAGLLYRVRDVFRAAGALVCPGRWLQRIPRDRAPAGGG